MKELIGKLRKSITETHDEISKEKNHLFCYFIVLRTKYSFFFTVITSHLCFLYSISK